MTTIKLPSLGENVESGTIVSILVKVDDLVTIDQPLMEVETDKVTAEVPCEMEGQVKSILVNLGDEIGEGTALFEIETGKEESAVEKKEEGDAAPVINKEEEANIHVSDVETASEQEEKEQKQTPISIHNTKKSTGYRASPLAKKLAREIGIDISKIEAKSPTNRISVKDVKSYARTFNEKASQNGVKTVNVSLPDFSKWGTIETLAMDGITKATSRNMVNAWSQIPHAWLQEKADITELEGKRQKYKADVKKNGGSLTITAILVSIVAKALAEFNQFNASVDASTDTIILKKYIHIGVAVDTDRGLLVPKIEHADRLKISEIAMQLSAVSERAKKNKLSLNELEGASFTISNLGGIGTTSIFPIVNHPQVAILGIAKSKNEPIWNGDTFEPRLMMPLTIGFDHRIINGADAARFLQKIKDLLEDTFLWGL